MVTKQRKKGTNFDAACRHLSRDPVMKKIIKRVGGCQLRRRKDYFIKLCESIFSQQISVKIADILYQRFRKLFPGGKVTPAKALAILKGDEATLKKCGLSRQKRGYLVNLSEHFVSGKIPTRKLGKMTDDELIECLTQVKGIGRWTAEMFLIFVLNRPDVWPVDDLGLQESYKRHYKLAERPKPKTLSPLGDSFKPYRSIATWYLWRGLSAK